MFRCLSTATPPALWLRDFAKSGIPSAVRSTDSMVISVGKKEDIKINDFSLPPVVVEILKKSIGLSVISGPRRSGKTTLAQLLCEQIGEHGQQAVAVFSDQPEEYEGGKNDRWQIFPIELLNSGSGVCRGFDLALIDSQKVSAWRHAVSLAESGSRIFLLLPFPNAQAAIERLAERIEANVESGRARIAEVMQMVICLRLLPALDKGMMAAFELLLVTRDIRAAMLRQDWEHVEKMMHSLGEKTGMRTLNQCLMNLMLKRKIDMKSGFSESPRPDELDHMLEKVGF